MTFSDNTSFQFNHSTNQWQVYQALMGSDGADVFTCSKNGGSYIINNAESQDTVNLYDVSINDIISLGTTNNKVTIGLNTGSKFEINSLDNVSSKITLQEGSVNFNHSTNTWQLA